ncbi:hypothetical protein AAC387_Pa03g2540 [Persea americana]
MVLSIEWIFNSERPQGDWGTERHVGYIWRTLYGLRSAWEDGVWFGFQCKGFSNDWFVAGSFVTVNQWSGKRVDKGEVQENRDVSLSGCDVEDRSPDGW